MTWSGQFSAVGATHTDLMGGREDVQFRSKRVAASELGAPVTCQLSIGDTQTEWLTVYDLSPTGLGVRPPAESSLAQGTGIDRVVIRFRDRDVYDGDCTVVYQLDGGSQPRVGLRFRSNLFDLRTLLMSRELIGNRLEDELRRNLAYREVLSPEYRAAVADMQHLLQQTKLLVEQVERDSASGEWWQQAPDSRQLIEQMYEVWGPRYHEMMASLAMLDADMDADTREHARAFATDQLMPLFFEGPLHRRSYEKPRGYAGDYKAMTMCFADRLLGNTWWGKFLHNAGLQYPMVQTVPAREANVRRVIHETVAKPGPKRIVSLACGPAIEINRFIREVEGLNEPVAFYLIDQDKEALSYCHETLSRALAEHHQGRLPVTIHCLHFSVKQLLRPETPAEKHVVENVLNGVDLIYSAGLMDYLPRGVAQALIRRAYSMLKDEGRLFIGNLKREPLTAWLLESVLAWHLDYRSEEDMHKLAAVCQPVPSSVRLDLDDTGHCMFLDVVKPAL